MMKILHSAQARVTTPPPLTVVIALGAFAIASILCGCEAGADGAREEDRALVEAGLLHGLAADHSEQDSTPMVVRRVWGGPDVDLHGASVSSDGRYLTFIDWVTSGGDVMVREVSTGKVERVTHDAVAEPYQTAEDAKISPDGSQVAYLWYREDAAVYNHYELRVIRRGEREPRLLYRSEDCAYPELWGWSPGGGEVLFTGHMTDGTRRLMAVSAADGSVRTVKDFGPVDPSHGAISPDGEHAVYDAPEGAEGEDGDIFVLDLETGRTSPLIRDPGDDFVLGWSPRGEHILFASDRAGSLGAWLLPMAGGRPSGDPRLVKADLWRAVPIGFAQDGSFFYGIPLSSRKVHIASIDPKTGAVLASPTPVSGNRLAGEGFPDWSPDGRYLAYLSIADYWGPGFSRGRPRIVIRSLETGDTRELVPDLEGFGGFRWYPEGRHLLVHGGRDGQEGLFKVDIETGDAEVPEELEGITVTRLIDWGPDGRKLFYRIRRPVWRVNRPAVLDLDAGRETVLYDGSINYFPGLSVDGRYLAFAAQDGGIPTLMVTPTAGGAPRALVRFERADSISGPLAIRGIAWSRDGQTLIYARDDPIGMGLWRVPVTGGSPERIELSEDETRDFANFRNVRLHPDGRRIAFDVGVGHAEVWVMEDFLPAETEPGRSP